MKVKIIVGIVAVLAVVAGLVLILGEDQTTAEGTDGETSKITRQNKSVRSSSRKSEAASSGDQVEIVYRKGRRYKKGVKRNLAEIFAMEFEDEDHPYSEKDKKVATALEEASYALDAFDESDLHPGRLATPEALSRAAAAKKAFDKFFAAAAAAAKSENPAVRRAAVEAYSWQGSNLIPELTPLMADPDPEVAEVALDAVETRLDEMEDPALRFETAAAYMDTFASNEDALSMFETTLATAASEVIDAADDSAAAEERARENRDYVVDVLAELIEKGDSRVAAAAKEAYSDITSEEWINFDEARRWASDPEGYEAP